MRVLRVLRDRWLIIVLVAAVCTAGALLVSLRATKQYDATAKLLFREDAFSAVLFGSNAFETSNDPAREAQTNVDLTTSSDVAAAVKRALNLKESVPDVLDQVSASAENNADIVDVTVKDHDPARAARLANAFVWQFVRLRQAQDRAKVGDAIAQVRRRRDSLPPTDVQDRAQLAQQLGKLTGLQAVQFGNVSVANTATVPGSAVSPKPKRDAAVALLLGLILGGGLALLLDVLDRRIKTPEDMEAGYGLSLIGIVPQSAFSGRATAERGLEAFRMLRSGLEVVTIGSSRGRGQRSLTLVVTSAVSEEGKTTVSVNLARVLAAAGHSVVLVEADLRRPAVGRFVGMEATDGLTTALVRDIPVSELLVPDLEQLHTLKVLPSGPIVPNASELLRSPRMDELLRELEADADYVIIDAPPMVPVADTMSLIDQPAVNAVIVIARVYHVSRPSVRRARELLRLHRVQHAHLVVTGLPDHPSYGYDRHYSAPAANGRRRRRRRETGVIPPVGGSRTPDQ